MSSKKGNWGREVFSSAGQIKTGDDLIYKRSKVITRNIEETTHELRQCMSNVKLSTSARSLQTINHLKVKRVKVSGYIVFNIHGKKIKLEDEDNVGRMLRTRAHNNVADRTTKAKLHWNGLKKQFNLRE